MLIDISDISTCEIFWKAFAENLIIKSLSGLRYKEE
jgi:hypothetical protein